jgi:hypothetical protein
MPASVEVFCTLEELWRWLWALCREQDQACLVFSELGADGQLWVPGDPRPAGGFYGAFAYPRAEVPNSFKWEDQRPKVKACIEVRRGRQRDENVLLLTEFLAYPVPGQDGNRKALNWLRRRIKKETSTGVKGVNPVTGGGSVYDKVHFTSGALEFLEAPSRSWKTSTSDRIVYFPATEERQ